MFHYFYYYNHSVQYFLKKHGTNVLTDAEKQQVDYRDLRDVADFRLSIHDYRVYTKTKGRWKTKLHARIVISHMFHTRTLNPSSRNTFSVSRNSHQGHQSNNNIHTVNAIYHSVISSSCCVFIYIYIVASSYAYSNDIYCTIRRIKVATATRRKLVSSFPFIAFVSSKFDRRVRHFFRLSLSSLIAIVRIRRSSCKCLLAIIGQTVITIMIND